MKQLRMPATLVKKTFLPFFCDIKNPIELALFSTSFYIVNGETHTSIELTQQGTEAAEHKKEENFVQRTIQIKSPILFFVALLTCFTREKENGKG